MVSDFISLADFSTAQLLELLDLADELKKKLRKGEVHALLEGHTLAMIFEKSSLRNDSSDSAIRVGLSGFGGAR